MSPQYELITTTGKETIMKVLALLSLAFVAIFVQPAAAQNAWKPGSVVQIIVPAGAGGSIDMVARQIQKLAMQEGLVESVIVVNRPGGAMAVALNDLDRQAGSGDYLMSMTNSLINNNITGSLNDRTYEKYTPLSILFDEYIGLIVHKDSPFKSARDLVAHMKEHPDDLNIAVASALGNHVHVGAAMPLMQAGVDVTRLNFVPYKSSAESITHLLGKNVDVVAASTPNFLTALQNDQLRILVVGAPTRLEGVLNFIPTWKEEGVDVVTTSIQGFIGPAGMTPEQIRFWGDMLANLTASDEWKDFVALRGWNPNFAGPDKAPEILAAETRKSRAILNKLGLAKN